VKQSKIDLAHYDTVERVALAIEATMFAPHELPLDADLHGKYRDTARAAIAAMPPAGRASVLDVLRDARKNIVRYRWVGSHNMPRGLNTERQKNTSEVLAEIDALLREEGE
jgi:hypothetical protein